MYSLDIFSVNETYSIISGGSTGDPNTYNEDNILKSTWFYNHVTQKFYKGPGMMKVRNQHVSGSLKYGNQEAQIVAGGFGVVENLHSVEILIDGQWIEGKYAYN